MTEPLNPPKVYPATFERAWSRATDWIAETKAKWKEPQRAVQRMRFLASHVFALTDISQAGNDFRLKKFEEIDARLQALESQAEHLKNFGYVGTWQKGAVHHHGHLVTDGGGLWHCMRDNAQSRPGTNGDDWRLCVKKGAMS